MEYLVNVAVHGLAGLTFGDKSTSAPSPFVRVLAFGEARETRVVEGAASCSLEGVFSISKRARPEDFAKEDVHIVVLHCGSLGLSQVLGQVVFSLRRVRAQRQHMVPTAWFPAVRPENPGEVRGFVRLTIGAYGPGDKVPRATGASSVDGGGHEAEGSTVRSRAVQLPFASSAAKNLYQLTVRIHQAEGLRKVAGMLSDGCHPYVSVEFNGTSQRTQGRSSTAPIWNEEVRVPFMMPCWDDSISLRVLSAGGPASSDRLLGELCLYIDDLGSQFHAAWHNFYAADEAAAGAGALFRAAGGAGGEAAEASLFAGRLLVSAQVQREEQPELSVGSGVAVRQPSTTKHVLWADFFEVCFDSSHLPEEVRVGIAFEPFLEEVTAAAPERRERSFVWAGEGGRLAQEVLQLPEPAMCGDVVVSVYAKSEGWLAAGAFERCMYLRLPLAECAGWDARPRWHELRYVAPRAGCRTAGFALMSVCVGPQQQAPKRPPLEKLRLRSYTFRAFVYQAANLPVKDREGTSDPFVVIFFGSAVLRTEIVGGTLNPSWFQVLEARVEVAESRLLRPDIYLMVADLDEEAVQPMAHLRRSTCQPGALPAHWVGAPEWLQLEAMPGGPATQARLLAAFELEPLEEKGQGAAKAAQPATASCSVDFYAVGVRMCPNGPQLRSPQLQVAWGRSEQDRSEPRKAKYTRPGRGGEGQFNFLEQVSLSCRLAKDPVFQDWLEVKLLSEVEGDESAVSTAAFATIQLAQFLPWVDEAQRQRLGRDFAPQAAGAAGASAPVAAGAKASGGGGSGGVWPKAAEGGGWDAGLEASNARLLGAEEFTNLTEEDERRCGEMLEECRKLHGANEAWGGALADFARNFQWPLDEGAEDLDRHPDLDHELELGGELPYSRAELLVGSEWGGAEVVGVLKFRCRVTEKERSKRGGPEVERESRAWEAGIRAIEQGFRQATDLHLRAYVLSADGLTPCSGSSDCSTYVWTRAVAREDDEAHSFRDSLTVRHHSLHPQFHKCHSFSGCRFPENASLHLSVVELVHGLFGGTAGEEAIGSTSIDLEDRWFNQRYRSMVKEDVVPIEARELKRQDSSFSRGHVRLWLDIMSAEQSQARHFASLPSTEPLPFQLRVVVWKVTGIDNVEGQAPDIYVSGWHELDDGRVLRERTDTHYGADDGVGTFNWRLIFDLAVPCRDPRLLLRVWNDKFIMDDPLAEATLDLSRDFLRARREHGTVELLRGSVRMTHPSFPGDVCGVLELEAVLLPGDEAIMRPAGVGREEPNQDPFLDGEDPHIKAHRDYVGSLAIVQNIQAIGQGLFLGMKLMSLVYVLGSVLGALGFIVTTIIALS